MAMRCPICDAKLISGQLCKYCGVTREEIINGSNKKVKEYKQTDREDLIYFTNIIPKDVSKVKLTVYTILLGWLGINHFYVLRNKRALFSTINSALVLLFQILSLFVNFSRFFITELIYEIVFMSMAVNVLLWVWDIFAIMFKGFKVPIVLGKKENK